MSPLRCWKATPDRRASCARHLLAVLLMMSGVLTHEAVTAAPMRFERLGLDDGLSQLAVLAVAQDATGFMWFGTEDGLDRFDGYSFKHLRQSSPEAAGLTDDFISDVQFDGSGRMWLGTDGGAVLWRDSSDVEFHSILAGVNGSAGRGLQHVRVMRFDHAGRLWIGTRDAGVALFDRMAQRLVRLRHRPNDSTSLA